MDYGLLITLPAGAFILWRCIAAYIHARDAEAEAKGYADALWKPKRCPDCGSTRVDLFCGRCGWADLSDARYNVDVHGRRGKNAEAYSRTVRQHNDALRGIMANMGPTLWTFTETRMSTGNSTGR